MTDVYASPCAESTLFPSGDYYQRLCIANEAWNAFVSMERDSRYENTAFVNPNMALFMFSRFVHELVLDSDLRARLLAHIDSQRTEAAKTLAYSPAPSDGGLLQ
jgi:hypothetical protein